MNAPSFRPILSFALAVTLGAAALAPGAVSAQESAEEDGATSEDTSSATAELPTGEPISTETPATAASGGPEIYARETHGDWEVRCLRAPEGQEDPCQIFQRLSDQSGNPTADINVFDLPDSGDVVAGATILTPLQTLLTAQVTFSIDGGQPRRYPFAFCDASGCYARLGLTQADVNSLRRGASGKVVVVPAQAPDQQVELGVSLTGFTAGFAAIAISN